MLEALEDRRLYTTTLGNDGALRVITGTGFDKIYIHQDAGRVHVNENGQVRSFGINQVRQIIVRTGTGNDTIQAAASVTRSMNVDGGTGHDTITGGSGNDILQGGLNNDFVEGGAGNDMLYGHDGRDLLYGGAGNDVLNGWKGHDYLAGGEGDDRLFGGDGDDLIDDFSGRDRFFGGNGVDHLSNYHPDDPVDGADIFDGGAGLDSCDAQERLTRIFNVEAVIPHE
jgi:Ca2+-binding RTX toxin-like protein